MKDLMTGYRDEIRKKLETDRKANMSLFNKRKTAYNRIKGIRVGDWVKENGDYSRVTYIWKEGRKIYQIQTGGSKFGQFYLGDKYISYSGGLDTGFNPNEVKHTQMKERRDGSVWFFKNNYHVADNAVEYMMKFRVFKVKR